MASPGNPNQVGGGGAFDVNKFFKPSSPIPQNPSNLSSSPYAPPLPSYAPSPPSSFPPPTGPYSYPPQASSPFHHQYQPHHLPYAATDHQLSTLHHQRSISFPTPPLQLPSHIQSPSPNPNPGARLMALLSSPPPSNLEMAQQPSVPLQLTNSGGSDFSAIPPSIAQSQTMNSAIVQSAPLRMPSSKLPKGRHLAGDHAIYDIDVRLQGEVQPQLEVTPITKYVSDPQLVVGRQIAVNKTYICYGLKLGNIRILNINTALRSLFRGHTQRVTDMAFFAEDVHLLASVSIDGRVCVWKISEGPDEEDKPQITGTIVIALQITGDGEPKHPRVCWHCHKQEVLVVGFGQRVLRIDTTKIGKGEVYSAEEPLKCPVDRLIDGVQTVGKHDGEVTDLSMCQWMTTRLVSASMDGTIKIWEDRKALPLCVLRPHDGEPVYSATFLTAPHRPDHIILITAGPQNREVKIWVSASEEGWLLPSDAESWHCTQRLDLKSSSEPHIEEAFFNQVVALPQAGLLLLANAKKNAIYAVHLEYGLKPAATAMDYIAEFTVTMPILSFTGTSDLLPHGERIVQVYCVQTQAIQQYALDLAQCLPPPLDHMGLEKSDSTVSRDATNTETIGFLEPSGSKTTENRLSSSPPKPLTEGVSIARSIVSSASTEAMSLQDLSTSPTETKSVALPPTANGPDIVCVNTPPAPLSPRLSGQSSGLQSPISSFEPVHPLSDHGGSQTIVDYPVERQMDNVHAFADSPSLDDDSKTIESNTSHDDISPVQNPPVMFKHPTHLVTPSEIFMAASSSESTHVIEGNNDGEVNIPDVVVGMSNVEMEVKVAGEVESILKDESVTHAERQNPDSGSKEKSFCSQVSDLGIEMAKENSALLESYITDEARRVDGGSVTQVSFQSSSPVEEGVNDSAKDVSRKVSDSTCQLLSPPTKGKKQKGKNSQLSGASSPSPSAFNSTDSLNEAGVSSSLPSMEASFPQIVAMQETVNQLMSMQKELQKQMTVMVAVPVTKEGRRLEAALGRCVEKAAKANADALWARIQEEHVKQERLLRDRTQQITMLMNNFISKDLPTMLEKAVKKEVAAIGPAVARTITTSLEKAVASVITDTLQRGLGDKAVNQLDKSVNSKLEATVARQIQAQFQTSGKQALQETLKSSLESAVIPAFELSCKAMFDQVDATFQKGITEHTTAAQQQFESSHSPLAIALRDAVNSASSMTQTLSGELAEGQRKLLAFVAAGGNTTAGNPLVTQMSNGSVGGIHEKAEAPLDPTKELSRLISEHKYEEAFTGALQRSDVSIVSWLCSQVDMQGILAMVPMPLSQGVLLSLLQQLACGISKDTPRKLGWMTDVAVAINPADPMIVVHVRPIFEQVYQILNHHRSLPTTTSAQTSSIRLVMHVINSMLSSCK